MSRRQRFEKRETEDLLEKQRKRMEQFEKSLDRTLSRAEATLENFSPPSTPYKKTPKRAEIATQTPDTVKEGAALKSLNYFEFLSKIK